ncbi:phosphoribosylaminoimidazolesuccinocarboxamide synthase [Streptomyces sp. A012304]|uniref:phosphoribosylaminoimidazolesuccinocarboxamide synthase n=1 Tax=Streptomyces sp. A012304 TaxID=375446 RepID=UPI00222EAC3D|nr:phosphoribosylaminoimidazolesuccinocarboxamide synthase [Streptomyces sp. A012304]GKQ35469.1 phosphoribosylaminoimidazole-succinocarboxamide synthase [Streptomyces sp. A012304]
MRTREKLAVSRSGKVRDIYELPTGGDNPAASGKLALVATDRMSASDVVLGDSIPGKGLVVTALTCFWLRMMDDSVPHHLVAWRASELPVDVAHRAGRAMVVEKLDMVPLECVVRGYLTGSAWQEYQETGRVAGRGMPEGMVLGSRLPEPLFTPAIKRTVGPDENVSEETAARIVGRPLLDTLRESSLDVYRRAARFAEARGLLIADTKFEFGIDTDGNVVLADEVLTPDSSRFWLADTWRPGSRPHAFDRSRIKQWLGSQGWRPSDPVPPIPRGIIDETSALYREVHERLTGNSLEEWVRTARGEVGSQWNHAG